MRRRHFDSGDNAEELNLTKFEEKYILPTDAGVSPAPAAPAPSGYGFVPPAQQQTPVPSVQNYATSPAAERPLVFALRAFKDVYVYEYSDRLEYYNHTADGMVKCNVEYKRVH